MIAVLVLLAVLALALVYTLREALVDERARSRELLLLLETKAAPTEVAAYLRPPQASDHLTPLEWIATDDGLIEVPVSG